MGLGVANYLTGWYVEVVAVGATPNSKGTHMATKASKSSTTTPAPTKAQLAQQVTTLRNAGNSWATIANQLGGMAPRTARSLYQLANGAHSHHGTLPGKGGRYPVGYVAPAGTSPKGSGTVYVPRTAPNGAAGTLAAAVAPTPAKAPRAPRKAKGAPKA